MVASGIVSRVSLVLLVGDQVVYVGSIGCRLSGGPAVIDHQSQSTWSNVVSLDFHKQIVVQSHLSGGGQRAAAVVEVCVQAQGQAEGEILCGVLQSHSSVGTRAQSL